MLTRKCYLLTCDEYSERTKFSKNILEKIGFQVNLFMSIPNKDKVFSNKISMMNIYDIISKGDDEWVYVFEDDINILENINLDEIILYEKISSHFFYLGLCKINVDKIYNETNEIKINNHKVIKVSGDVRGLHAICLSKKGALELLEFTYSSPLIYMDMILEKFSIKYPANVIRYDLESYIIGHRGIFFQDRNKFPSTI
jgi:hypothetical protein